MGWQIGININADKAITKICSKVVGIVSTAVTVLTETARRNETKRAIEKVLSELEPGNIRLKSPFNDGLPIPFLAWLCSELNDPDLACAVATTNTEYQEIFWKKVRPYLGDFSLAGSDRDEPRLTENSQLDVLGPKAAWMNSLLGTRLCDCYRESAEPTRAMERMHGSQAREAEHLLSSSSPASKCHTLIRAQRLNEVVQELETFGTPKPAVESSDFEFLASWAIDGRNYVLAREGNRVCMFSAGNIISAKINLTEKDFICGGSNFEFIHKPFEYEREAMTVIAETGKKFKSTLQELLYKRSQANADIRLLPIALKLVKMAQIAAFSSHMARTTCDFDRAIRLLLKTTFFQREALRAYLLSVSDKSIQLTVSELRSLRGNATDVESMKEKLDCMNTFPNEAILNILNAADDDCWMTSSQIPDTLNETELSNRVFESFAKNRKSSEKKAKTGDGEGHASLLVKAAILKAEHSGKDAVMASGLEKIISHGRVTIVKSPCAKIMSTPGLDWAFLNITDRIDFASIRDVFAAPIPMEGRSFTCNLSCSLQLLTMKERGSDLTERVASLVGDNYANLFNLMDIVLKSMEEHADIQTVSVTELEACARNTSLGRDMTAASTVIDMLASCAKRGYNESGDFSGNSNLYKTLLRIFSRRGAGLKVQLDKPVSGSSLICGAWRKDLDDPEIIIAAKLTDGSKSAFCLKMSSPGSSPQVREAYLGDVSGWVSVESAALHMTVLN